MENIMEQSLVNYDVLQQRMSQLINKKFELQYLLFTLMMRTYSSNYEGFALYFKNDLNLISTENQLLCQEIVNNSQSIDFLDIKGIPLRGNKVIDLINIYIDGLTKLQTIEKQTLQFINNKIEYKITMQPIALQSMNITNLMLNKANKIKKSLDKAINNYEIVLLIDYKLGEEYKK